MTSALALPFIGPLIDRVNARYFCVGIALLFIVGLIGLNYPRDLLLVFVSLFCLRLAGQGLCTHVNGVCTARYFGKDRGKALSLSNIGFPLAEGLITPVIAITLVSRGLHWNLLLLIAGVTFIYLPVIWFVTRQLPEYNLPTQPVDESDQHTSKKSWTPREVIRDPLFYFLITHSIFPAFSLTGFLVYQAQMADAKDWPLNAIALAMGLFALGRILASFLIGPVVDALGALKLFPFYQLPLSLGFLLLWAMNDSLAISMGLFLCGLTVGSAAPIKSSMWAELYGIAHLGAIKSLFGTIVVVVTAVSPLFFGIMIDAHREIPLLLGLSVASLVTASLGRAAIYRHRLKNT